MIRHVVVATLALAISFPTLAQSQPTDKKPAPRPSPAPTQPTGKSPKDDAPKTKAPAEAPDKAAEPAAKFPEIINKRLRAKADYRGKKAPTFKVERWVGDQPSRKDKVILVDFWATWCGPCKALIPKLQSMQEKFKDDLIVVGLSDESESVVRSFVKDQLAGKPGYYMGVDTKASMKKRLAAESIPHVMIIDSKGTVRWQGFPGDSSDPLTDELVQQIIDADKAINRAPASSDKPSKKGDSKKPAKPAPDQPASPTLRPEKK